MITVTKKADDGNWYRTFYFKSTEPVDIIRTEATNLTFVNEGTIDNGVWLDSKGASGKGVIETDGKTIKFPYKGTLFQVAANVGDGTDNFTIFGESVPDGDTPSAVELKLPEKPLPLAHKPAHSAENPHPIESWFTQAIWDELFPKANEKCYGGSKPYTYEHFINAVRYYSDFANGSEREQKKELAAFLGISLQETGGKSLQAGGSDAFTIPGLTKVEPNAVSGWSSSITYAPDTPSEKYGLIKSSEDGGEKVEAYRSYSYGDEGFYQWNGVKTPLRDDQTGYWGSGMKQLTYAENFARFSQEWFGDHEYLLDYPDLVRTDGLLVILSAVQYWMTQADARPSCHCCFTGLATNEKDKQCFERITGKGYQQGLAMAICAVNGIECAIPADFRVATRANGYIKYGKAFGLTDAELLENCSLETQDMPKNLNDV